MISRPRAASTRCAMKKSARRKTDARRNESPQSRLIFCGKLLPCPATAPMPALLSTESAARAGVVLPNPQSSGVGTWRRCTLWSRAHTPHPEEPRACAASRRMATSTCARGHPSRRGQEAAPQDEGRWGGRDDDASKNEKTRPGGQPGGSSYIATTVEGVQSEWELETE